MFARVTISQSPPDQFDQTAQYLQEQLIPSVKGMPGLVAGYWMGDRQTGKGLAITLWESEAAMLASETQASQVRMQGLQALGATLTGVERYEVVGQV
jgi:hypothetical protein